MSQPSALHFPVFQSAQYAAANLDAAKDVKRGRYKTFYDHWQQIGRDEYLVGKRKPAAELNGFGFDEARYLSQCRDVRDAVAARRVPSAFEHWMRYGLVETLAGTRIDAFGLLLKEPTCIFETIQVASGEWITLIVLPGPPKGEEHSVKARDANGVWLEPKLTEVRRMTGGVGTSAAVSPGEWTIAVFSTPAAPSQVFLGSGLGGEEWSEVMVLKSAGNGQNPKFADDINLAKLAEQLVCNELFLKWPQALLALLPSVSTSLPSTYQQFFVDQLHLLDSSRLMLTGWFLDRLEPWEKILVLMGGEVVTIEREQCLLHARQDLLSITGVLEQEIHDAGFFAIAQFSKRPLPGEKALVLGLSAREVTRMEAPITFVVNAPDAVLRHCLHHLSRIVGASNQLPDFLRGGAGQILTDMIKQRNRTIDARFEEISFGQTPEHPTTSVIIPLYGRVDFIQFQLAHFSRDPEMADVELIYVLDDPKNRPSCLEIADYSWQLFRIPFRLLMMRENQGFGGANNVGASQARGEKLLFVNSDIIPSTPGWVSKLAARLDQDGAGIIGARLLYHDGTIQHDGMTYRRSDLQSSYGGLILCVHPGKGVVPEKPSAGVTEVPLVTGACLAIRKSDFEEVGGFSGDFYVGDYEDSDLCLKVRQLGKRVLLARDCVLYHLERQSVHRSTESGHISILNAYIHEMKWGEIVGRMIAS